MFCRNFNHELPSHSYELVDPMHEFDVIGCYRINLSGHLTQKHALTREFHGSNSSNHEEHDEHQEEHEEQNFQIFDF